MEIFLVIFVAMNPDLRNRNLETELTFSASRSGGPGGQNVNKVNTKIELRFHVQNSALLSEEEKQRIEQKLANRINSEGELLIVSQTERSQLKNKEESIERFYELLTKALQPVKKRKATKPTKASVEARIKQKKQKSEIKGLRKKPL